MVLPLPDTLQALFAQQSLPKWVREIFALEDDARVADLPHEVSSLTVGDERALEQFFSSALTRRLGEPGASDVICLPGRSGELELRTMEESSLSNRTRNAISRHLVEHGGAIEVSTLTLGDLKAIRGLGAKSIIEFLNFMESAPGLVAPGKSEVGAAEPGSAEEPPVLLDDLLFELQWKPWLPEVVIGDPRFPSISAGFARGLRLKKGDTLSTLVDVLVQGQAELPDGVAKDWAVRLRSLVEIAEGLSERPMDENLRGLIKAHYGERKSEKNFDALCLRLGLSSGRRRTLEEAGEVAGVTRERIRQIEAKVLKSIGKADDPVFLPGFDRAIQLMGASAGLSIDDFSDSLVSEGITESPVSPDALVLFAPLLGRGELDASVQYLKAGCYVISAGDIDVAQVGSAAGRLWSRNGVADVRLIAGLLGKSDSAKYAQVIRNTLGSIESWFPLDSDEVWWSRSGGNGSGRNRLVNMARKMLCVTNPLPVEEIRAGYVRAATYRNSSHSTYTASDEAAIKVPEAEAIERFFASHPDFDVEKSLVRALVPLDYEEELGDAEKTIVEAANASATAVMSRTELMREAIKRGLNENTLTVSLTYSPIVQHRASDTYTLIGRSVDQGVLDAHLSSVSQRSHGKRVLLCDWTPQGKIRICVRCPEMMGTMVALAPSLARPFVKDRTFQAITKDGGDCGAISADERGVMWGMAPFCRRAGLVEDDILAMEFDITKFVVTLYRVELGEIIDDISV